MRVYRQHHVGVRGEPLHHLSRLQIPQIHRAVLAATEHPHVLRVGDHKGAKHAVAVVAMALKRLQHPPRTRRVVPQADGVVERVGQDEGAVGGEAHKAHRRILLADDGAQTLRGGRVPDAAQSVVRRGHQQGAVAVEVHRAHRVGMRRQCADAARLPHIPQTDGLVE
eukprot:ctg_898.g386